MSETILKMTGIKKSFGGVHALRNGQLTIRKGEVLGLVGENGAGKSTLMNILLGIHKADEGEIWFKGKKMEYPNPAAALNDGISMIHQEVSLVPGMSVADNIWLGQEKLFKQNGLVRPSVMNRKSRELLDKLGINIRETAMVATLSFAQMQLIEIARAVSRKSDLILMDEPTSALTDTEVDLLYNIVKQLTSEGVSILFVSHKLPELFRFCDEITVMRDGEYIETNDSGAISYERLLQLIVGRENVEVFSRTSSATEDVALEVRNYNSAGVFKNVSFKVRRGEIVGFSGLMGAGRTEIMRAIFGCDPHDSGEILIDGVSVSIRSPQDAMKYGLGMVTEDRLRLGVIPTMSIKMNGTISDLREFQNQINLLNLGKEKDAFTAPATDLMLKYASGDDLIGSLSGGNQQKVIFIRWLMTKCRILLLDEPTKGIDVGAKTEIYRLIDRLAKEGLAVVLVSSELPEILALSDRINVVREGQIVYECDAKDATQETLIKHAFGV